MRKKQKHNLKIIPLGGLNEVGKNITAYEYDGDIILVDCGIKFPEDDMLGVDIVIPDMTYIYENKDRVKALFITHGHEDHIGAVPYLLAELNLPIYASKFTIGLIKKKLEEFNNIKKPKLITINPDKPLKIAGFEIDFIRVTHSIPDALAFAIKTDLGVLIHTGDFKIDYTPIDDKPIDLQKFADIGSKKVLLMLADSTNAGMPGFTLSEASVGVTLENIFRNAIKGRIIVASFSSNVHRLQQVINSAHLSGRKIAFTGRSMLSTTKVAEELGYIKIPYDVKIELEDIDSYPDNEVCIITTGSQGERLAGLSRMANGEHRNVKVREGDTVILSSSPIPGNEKNVNGVINKLYSLGAEVIYNELADVHVSGHAKREELKLIHSLVKPEYFAPVHGEYAHLMQHVDIARELGMSKDKIFVLENGDVLEYNGKNFEITGKVESGAVLIDGSPHSDVGDKVIKDRQIMSREGIVSVVLILDKNAKVHGDIEFTTRGFVSLEDEQDIMKGIDRTLREKINSSKSNKSDDYNKLKQQLIEALRNDFFRKTKRRPLILLNLIALNK